MNENNKQSSKIPKKKGPIRFEAIIPVFILSLLTFLYFSIYFDFHMKKAIEYIGTQANGAEVNVDSINTSFIKGSFDLNRLQVTDAERPSHNSLEIGNMHFKYLGDALLRMKFVVDDASINNIQLAKPRSSPGKVLPPKPKSPSKIDQLQSEVMAQIKSKYADNVLGDTLALIGGADYKAQVQEIRETLKSEIRANAMVADVKTKKEFWDKKVKELSDTSKLKAIEEQIQSVSKNKNIIQKAEGIKKLTDLLKDVNAQYKSLQLASTQLQTEVATVSKYPTELQTLVNQDVNSLKDRFSIPKLDLKEMAMHLFAGEFAGYIAKARKYQAVAKQYIPEKKAASADEIVPHKRSEGISYQFPITTGYPLFWLKRAAISSKGTADSYTGQVSGELSNVTTAPKQIGKPIKLEMKGDFPTAQIMGVKVLLAADFTKPIGSQSALIEVKSFPVPEKLFVNDKKIKFGFSKAVASSKISASLIEEQFTMNWDSILNKPQFLIETQNATAKEMLGNIINNIPVININGKASGSFSNLDMSISSNLGDELGNGFKRELGAKVSEAQAKINSLVESKISAQKNELLASLTGTNKNVAQLGNLQDIYKKNEERIQAEITKLKTGGGLDSIKDKGSDLFKKIKF